MDALDLLIADHQRVRGLFSRFKEAEESGDTALQAELGSKIFEDLVVHTRIEEEIFYPWVKGLPGDLSEIVDEGVEEHHVVDVLMEEMGTLPVGDDQWVAKMTVLIENVEHHAEEEESEMFKSVRSASTAEDRQDVGARMEALKARLGAPTADDAMDMTVEELKKKASEQEIPGRSGMSKEDLAAAVDPTA